MNLRIPKITFWRAVLVIIWTMGLYGAYVRFFRGLGSATNLSDQFPWGLWIGFDILVGVGLAAGGFVICATVYVFNLKDFKPIARPTVLTAFLGYLLVIGALMFDLGKPYNIWHPIIMWNPHSVMFEVGWCVMLYTTVLLLEFSPIVFEKLRMEKPLRIMRSITVPLVIVGVLLSTLHQSSLGTLYVIVPNKLHPLWYSGFLPVFFFISAIAAGLAMVIFESYLSARAFGKQLEFTLLTRLSRVIVLILGIYLIGRLQDLAGRGALGRMFEGSEESFFFLAEIILGVITPMILFLIPKIRDNRGGLFFSAVLVLLGFVMNRLNVAITGMTRSAGVEYTPSWMEIAVTLSIVAAGFVIFRLASKYLPIFSEEDQHSIGQHAPPLVQAGRSGRWAMSALGALLLITIIGMGLSWANKKDLPGSNPEEEILYRISDVNLELPAPVLYEKSADSPGQVTFHHESHVDPDAPDCRSCHQNLFSIRPTKAGALGSIKMEDLYEKKQCGVCHDGEQAFSVEEGCEFCHVAEQ